MSGQSGPQSGVRIEFEDVLVPEAFSREGTAVRAGDGEAGGLWGVVEGLARPEEAIVRRRGSRRSVSVALFRAGGGLGGHVIRLSPEAADELGLADEPVEVSVVAVRREPRIVGP